MRSSARWKPSPYGLVIWMDVLRWCYTGIYTLDAEAAWAAPADWEVLGGVTVTPIVPYVTSCFSNISILLTQLSRVEIRLSIVIAEITAPLSLPMLVVGVEADTVDRRGVLIVPKVDTDWESSWGMKVSDGAGTVGRSAGVARRNMSMKSKESPTSKMSSSSRSNLVIGRLVTSSQVVSLMSSWVLAGRDWEHHCRRF